MSAAAIAAAIQAGASIFGGIAANKQAKRNARRIDENARREDLNGAFEAERIAREERAAAGETIAIQALSGGQLGSGSALDTLRQSAYNREFDIAAARYRAATASEALRQEAKDVRRGGRSALIGGVINAAGTAASFASNQQAQARLRAAETSGRGALILPGSGGQLPLRGVMRGPR